MYIFYGVPNSSAKGKIGMTDKELLEIYVELVPFLATVGGPGTEIVVHDITDPERSLIAISNNLSGRSIGDPMTDLAKELQREGTYTDLPYVTNYGGKSKEKDFLSSTYFIKNEGRLIGLLCVNRDMSAVQNLNTALSVMLDRFNLNKQADTQCRENLDTSVTDILHNRIAEIIHADGIDPTRMSATERTQIVHRLNEEGLLNVKGAVTDIAAQLSVSVPTVYRYLNKKV